jgi:hypothetical protein
MGRFAEGSWLPALSSGANLGAMPPSLSQRYDQLYRVFAESWRVSDASSLFVYDSGTSTATFTDRDWPAEKPPCKLKPQFELPGVEIPEGVGVDEAKRICRAVTEGDLNADCVFDVATTGDKTFAEGYLLAQELRLRGTAVQIAGGQRCPEAGDRPAVAATVLPLRGDLPAPTGKVTFFVDGEEVKPPVRLDKRGQACLSTDRLKPGEHTFHARFDGDGEKYGYRSSTSPYLRYAVGKAPYSGAEGTGKGRRR